MVTVFVLKIEWYGFALKDGDGIVNSVDTDQTAPGDHDLHSLLGPNCPSIKFFTVEYFSGIMGKVCGPQFDKYFPFTLFWAS